MEKKSYSKPIMTAEAFEPQEHIAACWVCHLQCDGFPLAPNGQYQDHIFTGTVSSHQFYADISKEMPHPAHPVGDFFYVGDTPPDLSDLESQVHEFPSIVAAISALNHHGQDFVHTHTDEYSTGYCFPTIPGSQTNPNWSYCFVRTINWELKGQGTGPNAS